MFNFIARHASWVVVLAILFFILFGSFLFYYTHSFHFAITYLDSLLLSISSFCSVGIMPCNFVDLTQWGKAIMIFLMQIGGVGVTTFFMLTISLFVHSGVEWNSVAKDFYEIIDRRLFKRFFLISCSYMAITELLGAILFHQFVIPRESFFDAFFYAADCFCNAGFFDNNDNNHVLASYVSHPLFYFIGSIMMLLGGTGFLFAFEFFNKIFPDNMIKSTGSFSFTIRFGYWVYIITTCIACLWIFVGCAPEYSWFEFSRALFASISFRACGVNPYKQYSPIFLLLITVYSLSGTLPFATGGGLKTSIIGIFFVTLYGLVTNVKTVVIFGKQIIPLYLMQAHLYMMYLFITTSCAAMIIFYVSCYAYDFTVLWCYISVLFTGTGISWLANPFAYSTKIVFIIVIFIGKISGLILHTRLFNTPKNIVQKPEAKIIMF